VTAAFAASSKMNKEYTFGENFVIFAELSKEIQQQFNNFTGHVFIFSSEIAVKIIDPLLKSKTTEPAAVVMDAKANLWVCMILLVLVKTGCRKLFGQI
jgi:cobalamin biosynthesis protein CbiG